ncbi:unnamed protein product [Linum tenue]|uniref:Uncharacterized protein n=1 Tax=Linum tenue TaxID=586396 RepID=A0AAV0I3M9_9ROSI|nr:unnamed protein product [Linum tenue]
MAAAPKKPVNVPFGRKYTPTWAFDHIKYYNGGNDIQLVLDKYIGNLSTHPLFFFFSNFIFGFLVFSEKKRSFVVGFWPGRVSSRKGRTCSATSVCRSRWFPEIPPELLLLST